MSENYVTTLTEYRLRGGPYHRYAFHFQGHLPAPVQVAFPVEGGKAVYRLMWDALVYSFVATVKDDMEAENVIPPEHRA